MSDQLLLQSGSFEGLREAGSIGRPLYTLYPQLKAVIESELEQTAALLFAEPVVDEQRRRIDWYTQGTGKPVALTDLPESDRDSGYAQLIAAYDRIQTLANRYIDSGDNDRMLLGSALQTALASPAAANVFLVDNHPVVTYWGFFPEPSWGAPIDLPRLRDRLSAQTTSKSSDAPDAETAKAIQPPPIPSEPPVTDVSAPQQPAASSVAEVEKPAPILVKLFVVVGSKLFWSTVAIAVLLLVLTAVLSHFNRLPDSAQETAVSQVTPAALLEARHREIELRTRLNELLHAFHEQRLQCADCSSPTPTVPSIPKTDASASTDLGATEQAEVAGKAEATTTQSSELQEGTDAVPKTIDPLPESQSKLADSLESTLSKTAIPPEPTVGTSPDSSESPLQDIPESDETAPAIEAVPEPTDEERQEFNDRLATEGGKVGEITITLLWNNRNDLDLVVVCPTGERLYYNSPTVCGGTLDVDRNAGKQLTDRPVENIHWPQGQATSGTYRVAVKYYARKDGNTPPATPFQVRLLQNGQEQLFKGVITPDELKSVTDFTVQR